MAWSSTLSDEQVSCRAGRVRHRHGLDARATYGFAGFAVFGYVAAAVASDPVARDAEVTSIFGAKGPKSATSRQPQDAGASDGKM